MAKVKREIRKMKGADQPKRTGYQPIKKIKPKKSK